MYELTRKRIILIKNIIDDIDNCLEKDRLYVLFMIVDSNGKEDIYKENTGSRIKCNLLSDELLTKIDKYIQIAKEKTKFDAFANLDD